MMVDGLEARIAMGMCIGVHNSTTLRSAPSFRRTKLRAKPSAALIASSSRTEGRTVGGLLLQPKHDLNEVKGDDDTVNNIIIKKKKRVFFLDVNPICYDGSTPSLHSFAHWISLFFSEVSLTDPVIAVIDGEGAHEYRKQMLPSYKVHRRKFSPYQLISDTLTKCNVPVVQLRGEEADDVVVTLVEQVLEMGYRFGDGSLENLLNDGC
ncbi:unnamed protein product [Lactuca virosa]|uniref:5'-3' exonuclease alpha-helical arch N-terminal domain-containing protein n=1 Tax=Lactuca virosa TaxID=75947 RepID=A0AAU9M3T1_9ASTR|nr:unnamed protein product [Lactuca virosa]